jgi:hypothetical protein
VSGRQLAGQRLRRVEVPEAQQEPHEKGDSDQHVTPVVWTTRAHPEQIRQDDTEDEKSDEPLGGRCHRRPPAAGWILPHTTSLGSIGDAPERMLRKQGEDALPVRAGLQEGLYRG